MDYTGYSPEELIEIPSFRRWVWERTPHDAAFWEQWLRRYPERAEAISQAKLLAIALHQRFDDKTSDECIQQQVHELIRKRELADQQGGKSKATPIIRPFVPVSFWWRSAAAVILLAGLGWWMFSRQEPTVYEKLITQSGSTLLEQINTTDQPMVVTLSDGSTVTLGKNSRLSYPSAFPANQRRVYLSGDGFFNVAKNPARPFLVYANEVVTKVLGTSFRIKAFDHEPSVVVEVQTGRVSVYTKRDFDKLDAEAPEVAGVVLTPNQQVVMHRTSGRPEKGLVMDPRIIIGPVESKEFSVEEKPVANVLKKLNTLYGIDIMYDPAVLSNCVITTTFAEETLQERLTVICQAIGASYEVVDGQIIINSNGCLSE